MQLVEIYQKTALSVYILALMLTCMITIITMVLLFTLIWILPILLIIIITPITNVSLGVHHFLDRAFDKRIFERFHHVTIRGIFYEVSAYLA